jgi:sugar lactone lactonase YvrE
MNKFYNLVFIILLCVFAAQASEPAIWTINTNEDVLKGDAKGVSISDTGAISLAPKLTEVFNTGQSFVWSSAIDANGNVFLGTGSDGRIFRVDSSGNGKLFADLAEINVSALAIGTGGTIFAGTSPDGKVYRIDSNGAATVYFEPKEKYIWSLAVLSDGSLAVGTGENGKIYKVRSANQNAESSLLFDTSETHIISLASDKQGNLYAGTDSEGLVLRFSPDGKPFALLDSELREIHEISVGTDGSIYVLALNDSVSITPTTTDTTTETKTKKTVTAKTAKTTPTPQTPPKSRYDLTGAKSVVYRILPDGGSDILWNSSEISAFSIYAHQTGNGVLIGTSDKGRVYSISNDGRETLVLQTDEGQISTLFTNGKQLFAASSNQGKLYRFGGENTAEGTYESPVLDAKSAANWGRIWWSSNGNIALQTRSGNTEKPDETWSNWSASYTDQKGAQVSSPKALYLQWRAVLKGPSAASLSEVNVSYLGRNIAPEVLSIEILPTNIGLLSNPPIQLDPNIEISGLSSNDFGIPEAQIPPRKVFLRGARSLQWMAEDRNEDKLEYSIHFRETGEPNFKLLKDKLIDNFFAVDGTSLADGRYIFKIVANDSLSNPVNQSLSGEKVSEPVEIDNTSPNVSAVGTPQISGENVRVVFEATENSSYINRAEYSLNGGDWQTVYSDDGISDSPKERYTLNIPLKNSGEYTITLRVFDANGNIGNAKVSVKK